jgi:hypothetical protein
MMPKALALISVILSVSFALLNSLADDFTYMPGINDRMSSD